PAAPAHCAARSSSGFRAWRRRERAPVPSLRGPADARVLRPRHVALVERLPCARAARGDGAVLSAQGVCLQRLPAGAAAGVRSAGADLPRLRVLFLVLGYLGRALAPLRGD